MSCNQDSVRCRGPNPCCHEHLREMLDFTKELFGVKNIPFWLNYGTLLGAVRDQAMMPWDEDLDIGTWLEYMPQIIGLQEEYEKRGYVMQVNTGLSSKKINNISFFYSKTNSLHLGIGSFEHRGVFGHNSEWAGCYWPNKDLLNLNTGVLNGKEYPIPGHPEFGLTKFYGSDWRIPKVKKWLLEFNEDHGNLEIIQQARKHPTYDSEVGQEFGHLEDISPNFVFPGVIGYAAGAWDLFHWGHLRLLDRAKKQCDYLIVGVSTDDLVKEYKQRSPIIPYEERRALVKGLKVVDEVVPQQKQFNLGLMIQMGVSKVMMGTDWENSDNKALSIMKGVLNVKFIPRTPNLSTTILKRKIHDAMEKQQG